jgi:CDP-diacylglycerol--glycerol-3-phosphate 3-phosphatidyltransferase
MADSTTDSNRLLFVNAITLSRIPLAVTFAVVLSAGGWTKTTMTVGLVLLSLCEVTDFLDGFLARRLGVVSPIGQLLDPYADSITRLVVYWTLACAGLVWAVVPLGMAFRDISVSYCRIMIAKGGGSVAANWAGKTKAWVQGVGAFVLLVCPVWPTEPHPWVIGTTSVAVLAMTLGSLIPYAMTAIRTTRADLQAPSESIDK